MLRHFLTDHYSPETIITYELQRSLKKGIIMHSNKKFYLIFNQN